MQRGLVTVLGGSGFLGRYAVERLAARGWRVRVAARHPEAAGFLKPLGEVGQISPVYADLRDPKSVVAAVAGADAVINLVGILFERGRQKFSALHAEGAGVAAAAATKAGVGRFVQISALGADTAAKSDYARSKAQGEAAVVHAFPAATIVRPSVVFGPEDDFFNRFGAMARLSPALPLIGGGHTRFQPVYVCDVAEAIVRMVEDPATAGRVYELGGPRVYSFRELLQLVLAVTGRSSWLVTVPRWLAMLQGAVLQWLPKPPLTRDQVRLLDRDSVVGPGSLGLADLGIAPTPAEVVIAAYMQSYRRVG
jgi:NADH dehydrogenase